MLAHQLLDVVRGKDGVSREEWLALFRQDTRFMASLCDRGLEFPAGFSGDSVTRSFQDLGLTLSSMLQVSGSISEGTGQYLQSATTNPSGFRQQLLTDTQRTCGALFHGVEVVASLYRIARQAIEALGKGAAAGNHSAVLLSTLLDLSLGQEGAFARAQPPPPPDFAALIQSKLDELFQRQAQVEESVRQHTPMLLDSARQTPRPQSAMSGIDAPARPQSVAAFASSQAPRASTPAPGGAPKRPQSAAAGTRPPSRSQKRSKPSKGKEKAPAPPQTPPTPQTPAPEPQTAPELVAPQPRSYAQASAQALDAQTPQTTTTVPIRPPAAAATPVAVSDRWKIPTLTVMGTGLSTAWTTGHWTMSLRGHVHEYPHLRILERTIECQAPNRHGNIVITYPEALRAVHLLLAAMKRSVC